MIQNWSKIKHGRIWILQVEFNPFVLNASFLYPLKTSENRKVFWCFEWVEKGWIGNEWIILVAAERLQANMRMFNQTNKVHIYVHPCCISYRDQAGLVVQTNIYMDNETLDWNGLIDIHFTMG